MQNQGAKTVRVIVFSKDRGFQLEACLSSLFRTVHYSAEIRFEVVVLYKASNAGYYEQYRMLSKVFPEIVFVEEDSFEKQTLNSLSETEYTFFLVDDSIFFKAWSLDFVVKHLDSSPKSLGFSLRLGRNISYCYPFQCEQPQPNFQVLGDGVMKYSWIGEDYDYGYPLEVSSSVYRTKDVIQALDGRCFARPNELERELAMSIGLFKTSKPELLLFETSVAFACPINLVQEHRGNVFGKEFAMDVQTLAQRFDEGFRMDLNCFESFVPISCHQEVEIRFIRPD